MLVEVGPQFLYGGPCRQPGRLIELARLTHFPIREARDAPCRPEVIAAKRCLRGMFADHRPNFAQTRAQRVAPSHVIDLSLW